MNRPLSIILISREYPPFVGGGIGSYTVRLARALADAGHRPVVITVSADGQEHREHAAGVTVVRLPFLQGNDWSAPHPAIATPAVLAAFESFHPVAAFAMQVAGTLPRLVQEYHADLIEAPDTGALAWFVLNERRLGLEAVRDLPPVVLTIHSPSAWVALWNREDAAQPRSRRLIAMEHDAACWSDGLVCPSHTLADWAAALWSLPRDRIAIIPYPLGELEPVARRVAERGGAAPADGQTRRVLFVGRLEPRKGIETLLAAYARVRQAGVSLELHLVGRDTPDPTSGLPFGRTTIERTLPPAVRADVHVHGQVPPAAVRHLLDQAHIVVVPSPMDNFPYTCVEALAHGQIVVAAAAGGMAEMIRPGCDGLLFAPGDVDACAEALIRATALDAEARRAMSHAAAARILALCSNETVIRQRLAHWQQVIATHRTARLRSDSPRRRSILVWPDNQPLAAHDAHAQALSDAVEKGRDVAYAHGWPMIGQRVRALGTPTLANLVHERGPLGPLALSTQAADDPRLAGLLHPAPGPATAPAITPQNHANLLDISGMVPDASGLLRSPDTWALALALTAAGYSGAVVPHAHPHLLEAPGAPSTADVSDEALRQENRRLHLMLARLTSSRGYRFLQRVYDVLHVLRGRGWRRPRNL